MTSFLEQLTTLAADRLASDPFFWEAPAVEVIAATVKTRLSDLQQAISKRTLCAIVIINEAQPKPGNRRSPLLLEAKLDVYCVDDRTLNATGKTAELMAEAIAAALSSWQPEICEDFVRFDAIEEATTGQDADANRRVLRVRCSAVAAVQQQPAETPAPVIAFIDEQAVIVGPDNSTIRYTLDGTRPTLASTLYQGAVPLAPGQTITARAWVAGQRASLPAIYEA